MIFYGINPMFESLRSARRPERIYILTGKEDNRRLGSIARIAGDKGVPVEYVPHFRDIMEDATEVHQGVCAVIKELEQPLPDPPDLGPRVVVFDGIQDPHNFGAALRVCDVFGFDQVIYHKGNSSGLTPAAIKVSAGAAFHLNVYHSNLNHAIRRLKVYGDYQVYALHARTECSLYDCPIPARLCLVIGAEDKGVRHVIQRLADRLIHIPQRGHVDSLNVSCALSAALCEISRRSAWPTAAPAVATADNVGAASAPRP